MWQNEQENLDFLDIITILSFALQVQNSESHKIDQLRDEFSRTVDGEIKTELREINEKLDRILQILNPQVPQLVDGAVSKAVQL